MLLNVNILMVQNVYHCNLNFSCMSNNTSLACNQCERVSHNWAICSNPVRTQSTEIGMMFKGWSCILHHTMATLNILYYIINFMSLLFVDISRVDIILQAKYLTRQKYFISCWQFSCWSRQIVLVILDNSMQSSELD